AAERGDVHEPIERVRGVEKPRRGEIEPFHHVVAQMLVEPRPPGDADAIARLQHRTQPGAGGAAHQTEMSAMLARHHLEHGARLAVALDAEHDGFVDPLHQPIFLPALSGYYFGNSSPISR